MANRILKPDSSNNLILQDGDSVSRVTLNAGGTSVLSDEGGTSAIAIGTSGDVSIAENIYLASGKGIYFDGGTTSANYLGGADAYETGTWTPTFTPGESGTTAVNTGADVGSYTKIGRSVYVCGFFIIGAISSPVGTLILGGLPFLVDNNTGGDYSSYSAPSFKVANLTGSINAIQGWANPNTFTATIVEFTGTTEADWADHVQTGTQIFMSLTYIT